MKIPRGLPVYPWGDNEYQYFGDGSDAAIYFDGTDLKINPKVVGSGKVDFLGDVTLPADNRKLYFGASDDVYISFNASHLQITGSNAELIVDLEAAGIATLKGGLTTGDDLVLRANEADTYPSFKLFGDSYAQILLTSGEPLKLFNETSQFISFGPDKIWNKVNLTTGDANKLSWVSPTTTTDNIVGYYIDASSNLTMGTNKGVTGLKIDVKAANGSGQSYGIDVSGVPNTEVTIKYLNTGDTVTADPTSDAPNNWIKGMIATTAYYIPCYTIDGS